jgi:hypothetical protein
MLDVIRHHETCADCINRKERQTVDGHMDKKKISWKNKLLQRRLKIGDAQSFSTIMDNVLDSEGWNLLACRLFLTLSMAIGFLLTFLAKRANASQVGSH